MQHVFSITLTIFFLVCCPYALVITFFPLIVEIALEKIFFYYYYYFLLNIAVVLKNWTWLPPDKLLRLLFPCTQLYGIRDTLFAHPLC